ncbi:MAG: PKD domain-containing protein [Verrucomicrobia bacterium]|nr:PKD domain-containing protein [Verrucomicrobiota bacterium]
MKANQFRRSLWAATLLTALAGFSANAAPPVVKTVPWLTGNPLVPHPTYNTKTITLKGTCDRAGADIQFTWDFGDGSALASGTVADNYAVEATHAYAAAIGSMFTARLTIQDTSSSETGTGVYFVEVQPKSLEVEVNLATDEGLWYLHKAQTRSDSGGIEYGHWDTGKYGGYANLPYSSLSAANLNALEVNGRSASGPASDPYTETVRRGMQSLLTRITTLPIGLQSHGGSTYNPDSNTNGYGVVPNDNYEYYQGGMIIDAIVASGTPQAVTTTGNAPAGANPGILGRTYRDIVQDMVDAYAWAQYDGSPGGGWRYFANQYPDNSACQWAAIGMIAAERNWGLSVPQWVKDWNLPWLAASQYHDPGGYYNGAFGYAPGSWFPWGPYATTPSGMVQMAMDGIGRGSVGAPSWDAAETFMRDKFGNTGGPAVSIKDYYYGLFPFVKSMLLHAGGPIFMLQSSTPGVAPIDWYAAEVSRGAPTDGVARTLVNGQAAAGYWFGHNIDASQMCFETAWAIMMLHRTCIGCGPEPPFAVAVAIPNPGIVGQVITLDGSDSYHQDPSRHIVAWEWDTNADGIFDASGSTATMTAGAIGNYPVKLRVTDDGLPPKTAETILTVVINTPPLAPTADAGGPYVFCPQAKPWFLDGLGSINPDEGKHEPGCLSCTGDTLKEYAWDLDGDLDFNDAFGPTPDLSSYFSLLGPGNYLVQLRVTDDTSAAYPGSTMADQSDTDSAQVMVLASGDHGCRCVALEGVAHGKTVVLTWTALPGASYYNIYRGTVAGGPYLWIEATPLLTLTDRNVLTDVTYYYVVRPAALNGDELCQSNEVAAMPVCTPATVSSTPSQKVSNSAKYFRELGVTSDCYGRMQMRIHIGDSLNAGFVAGPFKAGDVVKITPGYRASTLSAGYAGVAGFVTVKGRALVWAVDPFDIAGPPIISP